MASERWEADRSRFCCFYE